MFSLDGSSFNIILTQSLLAATDSTHATSADQD
jgi:hypothetical protein